MGSVHVDLNMDPVKDIEHTEGQWISLVYTPVLSPRHLHG